MSSYICSLSHQKVNPYLKDGVVRARGQLGNAPVHYNQRHPVILPGGSLLTGLVVRYYYKTCDQNHSGIGHTFAALRTRYWIHGGSSVIRRVTKTCLSCRRKFKPLEQQIMADLPVARFQIGQPAFFHTGVDLFGPFIVKQGRSNVKRYGCKFTCMTARSCT